MWPCRLRPLGPALLVGCVVASAWCGGAPTAPSATSQPASVATPGGPTESPTSEAPTNPTTPTAPVPPVTPPATSASNAVTVFGDTGWCGSTAMPQVASLLDTLGGNILLAGDLAYPSGTSDEFRRCFHPDFGRFLSRIWAAPGNHDYVTPGADGYFTYFGERAGPDRRGYHAVGVAAWQVLMLNTNVPIGRGSAQIDWVRQQLQRTQTRCTLAVMHHPFDSSGPNGANAWLRDLWEVLHGGGADIVVAGHDHLYERQAPQDANGKADAAKGIRLFTVGTGGARLYGRARAAAHSEIVLSTYGVLRLELESALYKWEFIAPGGQVLDRGLNVCH